MTQNASRPQRSASRQRVLVVEDHPATRRFYEALFRQVGRKLALECIVSGSVPEARRIMKTGRIDLLILDWMLPGVSGLEFIKELRRDAAHQGLCIIMATAKGEAQDCAEALDAGADDFIAKPFSVDILLARLNSLAQSQRRNPEA